MAKDKKVNVVIRAKDFATRKITGLTKSLTSLKGLILGGLGFAVLAKGIKDVTTAAGIEEKAINDLNTQLKILNIHSEELSKRLQDEAAAFQKSTTFGNEEILMVQKRLLSLKVQTESLKETTQATLDFASAMGIDLRAAADLFGKAAAGNFATLSRYGITLDENIPKTEKFAAVLELVNTQFGGTAQAQVDTFSGSIAQLSNNWGDLKEAIGETIINNETVRDLVRDISGVFEGLAETIRENEKDIKSLASASIGFATSVKTAISNMIPDKAVENLKALVAEFTNLFNMADQHIILEFEKDLAAVQRQVESLNKLIAKGDGTDTILNKRLILAIQEEIKIRQQLKTLKKDENVTDGKKKFLNDQIAKSQKEITQAVTTGAEVEKKSGQSILQQRINFRVAIERLKREEISAEEALETGRLDILFDNLKQQADLIKKFNEERLNEFTSFANREAEAKIRAQDRLAQIESGRLRESLQDETLNWAERKEILANAEDSAAALLTKLSDAASATEIDNITEQLKILDDTLRGAEGAESIRDSLSAGFDEARKLIEILGRAKVTIEFDTQKIKTDAERAADVAISAFRNKLRNADLTVPIKATGTMIGEGG